MNQILVLVKDKQTQEDPKVFTYKAYLDTQDRFELIGQCDEIGTLIPGDPNLNPRHQKVAVNDVAVHVGDNGMSMEDKLKMKEELLKKYQPQPKEEVVPTDSPEPEPKQRKKPGPKPKTT